MAEPGRAYAGAFALIPARVRVWLPAAALVAGMLFALAYVLPRAPRNPLYETTVWSLLVLEQWQRMYDA